MLARRRPLTVKWIPNTATWNKSSERKRERESEQQQSSQQQQQQQRESRQLYHAQYARKHVADELARSLALYECACLSVCVRVGAKVAAANERTNVNASSAAIATTATTTTVSRLVSFKSCHGQRCQSASVPFWLPSNVVVVRLKHAQQYTAAATHTHTAKSKSIFHTYAITSKICQKFVRIEVTQMKNK